MYNRGPRFPWMGEENTLVTTEDFVAMREDLISDLKTHVPQRSQEWFAGLEATHEQFMAIHDKLKGRHEEFRIEGGMKFPLIKCLRNEN